MSKARKQSAPPAEIAIYGDIDPYIGVSAASVRESIAALGDVREFAVRLNSAGGNIFEGIAIFSLLRAHPARVKVIVDGIALSMASVVAMAGDVIEAAENSFFMIHNPVSAAYGESEDLRDWAEVLDKLKTQLVAIYAKRTKQDPATIGQLMDAETWFTAAEAVEFGLADRVTNQLALAASFDARRFQKTPISLRGSKMSHHAPDPATLEELQKFCPNMAAEFYIDQLTKHATVADAQAAAIREKDRQLAERSNARDRRLSGIESIPEGNGSDHRTYSGDAIAEFNELVAKKMEAGLARRDAIAAVARANPELHFAVVSSTNSRSRRVQDLIEERFSL